MVKVEHKRRKKYLVYGIIEERFEMTKFSNGCVILRVSTDLIFEAEE